MVEGVDVAAPVANDTVREIGESGRLRDGAQPGGALPEQDGPKTAKARQVLKKNADDIRRRRQLLHKS